MTLSVGRNLIFEGLPGDDPQDYLDDIMIAARQTVSADASEEDRSNLAKPLFRNGLRGEPKKWYRNTAVGRRADWAQLQEAFRRRFPWRASSDNAQLTAKIEQFERQANEKLPAYVRRTTELADQTDDNQNRVLRDRLFTKMCHGGNDQDRRVQERVSDRLHAAGKTDDIVETGSQNHVSMTRDDALREIGLAFRAMREGADRGLPAFVTPPPSYGGQTPYVSGAPYPPYVPPHQREQARSVATAVPAGRRNSYEGRRATFRPPYNGPSGDARVSPRKPFKCFNCGIEGHSSRECDKPQRPWHEQRRIIDSVNAGEPLPTDLNFEQPSQAERSTADGKRVIPVRTGQVVRKETSELLINEMMMGGDDDEFLGLYNDTGQYPFAYVAEKRKAEGEPSGGDSGRVEGLDDGGDVRMSSPQDASGRSRSKGRRADSPHPRKIGMDVLSKEELARRLREVKAQMQKRRPDASKVVKGDTLPIRAYEGHEEDRIDIGELLRITPFPNITRGQFLDRSPTLRA
ncbi:hypothetical protein F4774DRAFT_415121 [Daldinia eschscholtzii]|nr:hypothetical protein F4774DRAFT_415121 [Daldinia eschscholtzii]